MSPYLPLELVGLIVKEADKATLAACALVSHSWLSATRPHLFEQVAWRLRSEHFQRTDSHGQHGADPVELGHLLRFLEQ